MNYSVEYKSDEDDIILTKSFKGTVTMSDIISSWEHVINNKLITQNQRGIISDYRGINWQAEIEDLDELENYCKENINFFKNLRIAVLVDSPKIVLPIIFKRKCPEIKTMPFNTIRAATDWIKRLSKH